MEPFSEKIKLLYIIIMRQIGKIFFFLRIKKNRVIFESFSGDNCGCNPKYISQELIKKYGDKLEIIWALKDKKLLPQGAAYCKYRSFKHFIYRITSKVYVCNFLQAIEIPKRKNQIEIQTWHGGGCYKKVGVEEKNVGYAYATRRNMQLEETDYFIASSKYMEEKVIRHQFKYSGLVLETGMPRNDCLCSVPTDAKIRAIRKRAGIDVDSFSVLYAPTWRNGFEQYESMNFERVKKAFETRFGQKTQMIFRAHLYGKEQINDVLNLTVYPDVQELLYACDALITDYSSLMWDFSLTKKPCFLYVPDLNEYTSQRGFDMDIHLWGFPICESNSELVNVVLNFDIDKFELAMINHQKMLGSFEHGDATDRVVELISKLCGVK